MQQVVYEDITDLLNKVTEDLKTVEMMHTDQFTLYDSMSAIEIYDAKMDLKANLKDAVTLDSAIKNKTVKMPADLSVQELNGLFDHILGKEILWFQGQSLAHTIYTFAYLYDPNIYEEHKFLKPYLDALHAGGTICQDLIRHSPYLREEDYIPSTIGFLVLKSIENNQSPLAFLGEDEIIEDLINAEYELEDNTSQKKKKKKKKEEESKQALNEYDALDARLKLRRGLLKLYQSLKAKYAPKLRDQITNNINFVRKSLQIVKETLEHSENCEKYFIDSINKTLLCHIPPRIIRNISKNEAFAELEKMLDNLQHILQLSTLNNFYDIQRALENYSLLPKNILSRAYMDVNIFQNDEYFGITSVKQLALDALEDFNLSKGKEIVSNEKVIQFVENSVALLQEIVANNLRNRPKLRREACRLYISINIFAHDAYTLDQSLFARGDDKPHVLFLWVLDLALKLMVKQLFMGFEVELYAQPEYCIVFYLLDHIFSFLDRNFRAVLTKYDKDFIVAWQTKQGYDKKKKKLTDFQRKFFFEHLYYKALENYTRVMMRLSYLVIFKDIIPFPKDKEYIKSRYYQRLKIFDNIYFLKKIEFEEFIGDMEQLEKIDIETHYKELKNIMDANVKLLGDITAEEGIDERIKQECEKLKRICVLNSLAMMKLNMSKNNLGELKGSYTNTEHKMYPVLDLQKK